jgi:hypothetical protein
MRYGINWLFFIAILLMIIVAKDYTTLPTKDF